MSKNRSIMPQGLRFDVFRRDNFCCRYCGRSSPAVTLEVDHVTAVANGGTDEIGNLVTACTDCNRGKSAKAVTDAPAGARPREGSPLLGMFGHSRDADGEITWQFEIIGETDGLYACQRFSWLSGAATDVKLMSAEFMATCDLYPTQEAWNNAAERDMAQQREERQRAARNEPGYLDSRTYLEDLWSGAND